MAEPFSGQGMHDPAPVKRLAVRSRSFGFFAIVEDKALRCLPCSPFVRPAASVDLGAAEAEAVEVYPIPARRRGS